MKKPLLSQALSRGGAPQANPLKSFSFILLATPNESRYT